MIPEIPPLSALRIPPSTTHEPTTRVGQGPRRALIAVWLIAVGCAPAGPEPDARPEVTRILSDPRYDWVTITSAHTRIHFPAGSFAGRNQAVLPDRAEESRSLVLSRLRETGTGEPLDLFYVDGREDMDHLTGSPVTGFSYFDDRAVVLVFNERWRAFERHELAHVITLGTWPAPAGPAVVEGLATYVDGECGGYENGRLVRTLLEMSVLIPLDALATEFRQQDDLIGYLQAAGTIEFMVHRLGSEAISRLWSEGLPAAPGLLDLPVESFQRQFEAWLATRYDPVPGAGWAAIRAGGCGIDARPEAERAFGSQAPYGAAG